MGPMEQNGLQGVAWVRETQKHKPDCTNLENNKNKWGRWNKRLPKKLRGRCTVKQKNINLTDKGTGSA